MTDPNAYTVEITAPDISPYRKGNTGIDYATTIDSGKPGPHVMLTALAHGNEICGAIVLDELFRAGIRPLHGKLTMMFCNVEAFARFDLAQPEASRWVEEDFNRVWTAEVLDGPRDTADLRRARVIRPLVDTADLLLDIHSMSEPCRPLMVCGTQDKNAAFARQLGTPKKTTSPRVSRPLRPARPAICLNFWPSSAGELPAMTTACAGMLMPCASVSVEKMAPTRPTRKKYSAT